MQRGGFFGKIALEKEMVREAEILKALEIQLEYERLGKRVPRLGEALVAMGAMTADQVREVLRFQHTMQGELPDISPIQADSVLSDSQPVADSAAAVDSDCGLKVGDTFSNYKLLNKIGSGEMGSAWRAKHENGGKPVLLRVLSRASMEMPWAKDFDRQVIKATKLEHPGIQRILRGGLHEGKYYYISDFDQGRSLRSLLEERGALEVSVVTEMAVHLCAALQYAHGREMLHNNISPSSILIGSGFEVKLTAFGMVPDPVGILNHMAQEVGDIAYYTPPELLIAEGDTSVCGTWSDFYSVGAVLFHALTGVPAFHGISSEEVLMQMHDHDNIRDMLEDAEIDKDVSQIIMMLMDCDSQQRIKSAGELMVALSPLRDKYKFSPAGWNTPVKGKFFPGRKSRAKAEEISRPRNFGDFGKAKSRPSRISRRGSSRSKSGSSRSKSDSSRSKSDSTNSMHGSSSRRSDRSHRDRENDHEKSSSRSSSGGSVRRRRSERLSARRSTRDKSSTPSEPPNKEKVYLGVIAACAGAVLISLLGYQIYLTATQGTGVLDRWFNFEKRIDDVVRKQEQKEELARQSALAKEQERKQRIAEAKRIEEERIKAAAEARIKEELARKAEDARIRKVAAQLLLEQQKAQNSNASDESVQKTTNPADTSVESEEDLPAINIPRRGGNFLRDPDSK